MENLTIAGNKVLWKSKKENMAITVSSNLLSENCYNVYHRIYYRPLDSVMWEYMATFYTMDKAIKFGEYFNDIWR